MLVHMDGFDSYSSGGDLAFQYSSNNFPQIGTNLGRFGQGALDVTFYGQSLTKVFNNSLVEIWTGFAMKTTISTGYAPVISIISSSGIEAVLYFNTITSTFASCRGGNTTLPIGSSGVARFADGNWHYIEYHYKIDTSVGISELWVDNVRVFNNTGQNTTLYSNNSFTSIEFGTGQNDAATAIYDDWYVLDATTGPYNTTRLGDSRILTLRPNSDAGPNNGTPSAGTSHYAMVKEPQNDGTTTTITLSGISGQEELFGMTSLPANPTTIYAAKVLNYAEKTDASILNANSIIVSNSTISNSNTQPLLTNFTGISGIFESDPSTGSAWSNVGINSAQCGFKIA